MLNKLKPIVTKWYERVDTDEVFEVIAVDHIDGVVDVQNLEGDVAEMDMATWRNLKLERIAAPHWRDYNVRYASDAHVAKLNNVWEQWQQGSDAMH